jgi:hypothetical protein
MKIQPINLDIPRIGIEIKIRPIIQDLNDNTCVIQYTIIDENGQTLKGNRFELTPEEYAGWGYDNSYLEDIVLTRLELQRLII